jgi:hypothetical protein
VEIPVGGKDFHDWLCIYDVNTHKQYSVPGVEATWMKLVEIKERNVPPAIDELGAASPPLGD